MEVTTASFLKHSTNRPQVVCNIVVCRPCRRTVRKQRKLSFHGLASPQSPGVGQSRWRSLSVAAEQQHPGRRRSVTSQKLRPVPAAARGSGRWCATPPHRSLIPADALSRRRPWAAAGRGRCTARLPWAGASWLPWSRGGYSTPPLHSLRFTHTAGWTITIGLSYRRLCASRTPASAFLCLRIVPEYSVADALPLTRVTSREVVPGTWLKLPPIAGGSDFPPELITFTRSPPERPQTLRRSLSAPSWHMPPKWGYLVEKSSTPLSPSFLWLSHPTWQCLWAVGVSWDSFTEIFRASLFKEVAHAGSCLSLFVLSTT